MLPAGPCLRCFGASVVVIDITVVTAQGVQAIEVFQCTACHWRQPTPPTAAHWYVAYLLHVGTLQALRKAVRHNRFSLPLLKAIRMYQRQLALLRFHRAQSRVVL